MPHPQPAGYLAQPSTGPGRPILVLHAWWGLNEAIRVLCDRLAAEGFTAFAPDLYHGQVTDTLPGAEALSQALFADLSAPRGDLAQAAEYLDALTGQPSSGLAVIGFSLGAFFAFDLSIALPERIRTVVTFYGTHPGGFAASQAAYLCHFAEMDPFEPPEGVTELETTLRQAGRPATFYHYPGTGHWFFEPDQEDAYDAVAAQLAWERTLAFLQSGPQG